METVPADRRSPAGDTLSSGPVEKQKVLEIYFGKYYSRDY